MDARADGLVTGDVPQVTCKPLHSSCRTATSLVCRCRCAKQHCCQQANLTGVQQTEAVLVRDPLLPDAMCRAGASQHCANPLLYYITLMIAFTWCLQVATHFLNMVHFLQIVPDISLLESYSVGGCPKQFKAAVKVTASRFELIQSLYCGC